MVAFELFLTSLDMAFEKQFDETSGCFSYSFKTKKIQISLLTTHHLPLTTHVSCPTTTIRLWEDVWQTKPEIVKSRIRALLGISHRIPARLCKIARIDLPTLRAFLTDNHLQVPTKAKFKYGLFLPQKYFRVLPANLGTGDTLLVAVASFSGAKKIIRNNVTHRSFELIRFANLLNLTVVGGFDKLLQHFIREQHPDDIMTYADADWSSGESYQKLGFERVGEVEPQTFWVNSLTFDRQYTTRFTPPDPENWVKVKNAGSIKFLKMINIAL